MNLCMQADLKHILTEAGFSNIKETATELRMKPIYRSSNNYSALCVYKKTGFWKDFVTGQGGSFNDLLKLVNYKITTVSFTNKKQINLQKFITRTFEDFEVEKDHNYWLNRGISLHTLEKFDGGICKTGKMANRYVFPIYNQEKLIGCSGRSIINAEPKWKHIGNKNKWIYPFWNKSDILIKDSVILVESIGDCLSLYSEGIKNTIVTFGLFTSHNITLYLIKLGINKVIIAFNNDVNNRGNEAAEKECNRLKHHFDNVIVKLPQEKDFNEMLLKDKTLINIWAQNI